MPHDVIDQSFAALLDPDCDVEQVATGFGWLEGPVWHPISRHLLFSDIPGNSRHSLGPAGVTEVLRPTGNGNGMTLDRDLRLLVCEHATSSVARYGPDGERTVVASHFEGAELNSPNDVVVRADGSIYFTDPPYGRMAAYGVEREPELKFQGVFRVPTGGGDLQLVVDSDVFSLPNGLCFSPDERLLYVNDTEQANIRVFDVRPDGSLEHGRIFAADIFAVDGRRIRDDDLGVPDGMKCDEAGNVWVSGPGGVWVFTPEGRHIGTVRVPEKVANFHWGADDLHTLYLTASSSIYRLRTEVGPRVEPFMRHARAAAKG